MSLSSSISYSAFIVWVQTSRRICT